MGAPDPVAMTPLEKSIKPGDVVGGRFEITEGPVAVLTKDGWRCPKCGAETNSYGHHNRPCEAA